ncbi:hypothetical protein EV207_11643 [Scopulibacillus darangshiensis]|uniref:Uncharacterized protein n=1 Tax=Scopulibacillus darangshiensis TaxID=442528 RepID=A0A4R2P473_9BACL|nr:hypothetical protein EV207_11643 [Scopulibacillus darangshiensis]
MSVLKEKVRTIEFRSQKEINKRRQLEREQSINKVHERVKKILNGQITDNK